jgi:glycine/D-amino acid oxidase-like deaminating enzyme/nitrite reductase/ring-hydroxylating ferredoxin subunit
MDSSGIDHKFSTTYWRDIELPTFNTLNEDLTVDVALIGAGIAGITSAYLLSKEGLKVAIIEARSVLNGTTAHTTAKLTAQHILIYDHLIKYFGEEKAKLYYEFSSNAIPFVENISREKGIDCDFKRQDAYVYAVTDKYAKNIEKEWTAYQKLGIKGDLKDTIPFNLQIKNTIKMADQAQYHPLKFLRGLLNEAIKQGCKVFQNTTAVDLEEEGIGPKVITKDGFKINCNHVIIATNYPFYDKPGLYSARMYAQRSYIIGIKTDQEYPGGMYISADTPTRSLRHTPLNEGNLLIIAGGSHKTGQDINTLKYYNELQDYAEKLFGVRDYTYRWSAQDYITLDRVPYIGPITQDKQHILVATGFNDWGMANGISSAHLLADYVLNRDNPYKEVYSPSRFDANPDLLAALTTNADVALHHITSKVKFVSKGPGDLRNGEGSVVKHKGKKAGAYKDEIGNLYIVDTTCTHCGCECQWNEAEKSWDCACHGSRYSYEGDVIDGPGVHGLSKLVQH